MSQVTTVQQGDHTDDDLCKWDMDIVSKTRQMIKTAQRDILRFIVQTKRNYKMKSKKETKETSTKRKGKQEDIDYHCATDEETGGGSEQSSNKDQDSDVSFQEDQEEENDKGEKEEEWIEFIKRSTKKPKNLWKIEIPCWTETHRRMK